MPKRPFVLRVVSQGEFDRALLGVQVVAPLAGKPERCADIRALAAAAHDGGASLACNLSLTGGACPAVRLGADVAFMPMDEGPDGRVLVWVYRGISGEGRLLLAAGVELGEREHALLEHRLQEWRKSSDAAQAVARYLVCHPAVEGVVYPGVKEDASFSVAARTLEGGFGPFVDFRVRGGDTWHRVTCTPDDPMRQVIALEHRLKQLDR